MFFLSFAIFLAACLVAAATGSMFPPDEWYKKLKKPVWNPPNWVFPVVWSILYLAIAVAAARVSLVAGSGAALGLWCVQITLNTLWTPVFFGLRRMKTGLIVIGLLWVSVVATTLAFFQFDSLAGWLMVPYIAWVTTAAALNQAAIRLNPEKV